MNSSICDDVYRGGPALVTRQIATGRLLNVLQRGRIPWGVRKLADTLTPEAYLVDESDIVKLRIWINDDDDVPSELASRVGAEASETERGRLARIIGLYRDLKRLNISPPYASAFRERQDAWLAIQSEFQVFVAQSQAFFILFDHLTPVGGSAREDAIKKAKHCYRLICLTLHRRMVEFLAQLLLIVEGSDARIRIQLQAVGFNVVDPVCPPLPLGPFAFMGVMMIIAILGMVSVMPSQPGALPLGITAVLIGTTKTVALLAAILPKLRWRTFRPDSRGNFPFLPWIASAGFAAVISLLIDRTALAIAVHRFSAGLDFLHYPLTPMAPMSFVLGLSIAVICDLDLRVANGWARRALEGMLCGAAMVVGIFICTHMADLRTTTLEHISLWFPFVFAFSLGFGSGFFAPYFIDVH
jgi:hypothetical protein